MMKIKMDKMLALYLREMNETNVKEYVQRVINEIGGRNYIDARQTEILFRAHNNFLFKNTPEYTKSCSACRGRVYRRLKEWLEKQN